MGPNATFSPIRVPMLGTSVTRRIATALVAAAIHFTTTGYTPPAPAVDGRLPHRTLRQDGKFVHSVGRLQLMIGNLGETGNPDYGEISEVPAAEWPAGSGYEYLYSAGLWVGALDPSGIPHVSTATGREREFSPEITPANACAPLPLEQVADVRESYEGIPNGNRVISASVDPDDDGDGFVDEDFQNGIDDDLDGLCDEDFGAVGQQMFSCEYFDNIAQTRQQQPEHVPLGLRVRQTSYAWASPGQNDFVGMDYRITNVSGRTLRNVMVAIFADMDCGRHEYDKFWEDDQVGMVNRVVEYDGPAGARVRRELQMAYTYDNPDDPAKVEERKNGDAPGYIGCMFLNHTTDPSGRTAPRRVGISAFKFFSGDASFAAGGDPRTDEQRYQLMTDPTLDPGSPFESGGIGREPHSSRALDYRVIMTTGPFATLLAESTLTISIAWVMGLGLGEGNTIGAGGTLIENAIATLQVFDGVYTDFDGSLYTGQCGKETCLRSPTSTSFVYQIPESSVCRVRFHSTIPSGPEFPQYEGLVPWSTTLSCEEQQGGRFLCVDPPGTPGDPPSTHCASADTISLAVGNACVYVDLDCDAETGQDGRERLVHWIASAPLPAPVYGGKDGNAEPGDFLANYKTGRDSANVSAWFFPGDRKVTLKWNNFAELVRDGQRGNLKEFSGYRIYKAAGWKRPLGSNSPARDLWALLGEWRVDASSSPARPLSELIDPSAPVVLTKRVRVSWSPETRSVMRDSTYEETDTLFAVGRYSFVDPNVLNGFPYFYSIVPISVVPGATPDLDVVLMANPSAQNAQVVFPRGDATDDQAHVYVVPNPYKGRAEWDLVPRAEDPSGTKVTFMNLPRTKGTIRIFSLAGDLVRSIPFRGDPPSDLQYGKDPVSGGAGSVSWNLISRNGQRIVSGIYLYSVETELGRDLGRFVVIR
ncbi:MAG TPA: hypothetical protein VFU59_02665 [Candidatus Eisenbacteria bacterium]|nr:hypothetical protein [Candidatus Eisenbacteria bacterium]